MPPDNQRIMRFATELCDFEQQNKRIMRKLSLKNSILVNISVGSKARLEKVSSFTKLIRMICVILSFQIASNFCGLTFTKSALRFLSASPQIGIILVKKSAFNNWSLNRFKLSLRIRL